MLRNLIHDGDMFGIVSTGTSSISEQLTYDRQVLESRDQPRHRRRASARRHHQEPCRARRAIAELRYRAHVAFSTAYQLMRNLESLRNRRKAVIYISSGYDFNPFETSRLKYQAELSGRRARTSSRSIRSPDAATGAAVRRGRSRARAGGADPRRQPRERDVLHDRPARPGRRAGSGDEQVETAEWQNHVRETQDSLRVLAEQTGGIAVVNQNDFDKALKRIDAETSDYYVLGYYSTNPDPLKRTRRIEVKTKRNGVQVWSRTSYSLRPTPAPQ